MSEKTKKILHGCLGELLVDFTLSGCSSTGMILLEQDPGGASANLICAMS